MCGIAFYFSDSIVLEKDNINLIQESIRERGRDAESFTKIKNSSIYLFHSRLSIIDLNKESNQPFYSTCKKFCITFNGEIYNYLKLKEKLYRDFEFIPRTNSDTEILLYLLIFYGIKKTLHLIDGMFAFAYLNLKENKIIISRDISGEKPLFYSNKNNTFCCSSTLNSFEYFPRNEKKVISKDSLSAYLRYGYVPDNRVLLNGINKLSPGTYLEFNLNTNKYFISDCNYLTNNNISLNPKNDFSTLINESIQSRLKADVNVGCFLSGGIDSSLIASIASNYVSGKLKTFCFAFDENNDINEAKFAKEVATNINSDHKELIIPPLQIKNDFENIMSIFDEPLCDPSAIPFYYLCKLAKNDVKVCLTGDGADELFGGYVRYNQFLFIEYIYRIFLDNKSKKIKDLIFDLSTKSLRNLNKLSNGQLDRGLKLLSILKSDTRSNLYSSFLSHFHSPYDLLSKDYCQAFSSKADIYNDLILEKFSFEELLRVDFKTYLPSDILVKSDRLSMHNGLEIRSPFLSKSIISFSRSLNEMELKTIPSKILLRKELNKYLNKNIINRKKQGFTTPFKRWINTYLKEVVFDLLSSSTLIRQGYLDNNNVQTILKEHYSKERSWHYQIWNLICFQIWLKKSKLW